MKHAIYGLYFNGLNKGTLSRGEKNAISDASKAGIHIKHVPIDWESCEAFQSLLQSAVEISKRELQEHGELLLIGASAGGSLAVNIYGQLKNRNVRVVTLCSRLHEPGLAWWDLRSMERMAHIGTHRESKSFLESVAYCQAKTLPGLTKEQRQQIITVKQWADEVVPRPTMDIEGARVFTVSGIGHHHGIVSGIKHLEHILA